MRILITDDDKNKLASILSAINNVSTDLKIDNAMCGKEALRLMLKKKYDLLIIDLNLPFTEIEEPTEGGGKKVVSEIYRRIRTIYVPNYIVGLTQYEKFVNDYFNVWKIFHYKNNDTEWIGNLKKLITHIIHAKRTETNHEEELHRIIVEGETDFYFLQKGIDLFFPELKDKVAIHHKKSAGTNWVVNQSLIWMNSYHKDSNSEDLIAVSILDSDTAGINAQKEINDLFSSDKQRNILKTYRIRENHSECVKKFFVCGCKIQFEIESMFDVKHLIYANSKGWLSSTNSELISSPKEWDVLTENLKEFLLKKGLKEDELLYLKPVSRLKKEKFCNYILSLDNPKEVFKNFESVLLDVFQKLGLK
ncbi:response regulator [Winogradskyella luteola]|uniref:Response regulator n=1 Tax=Winogradskyella luteola TaxID=2828330 RepID=A0A9X1F7V6_9FLAO|nr:response regulator [Winogradskyella luteola]MBV7268951.1 response regulator [Winogradskyella luteola]